MERFSGVVVVLSCPRCYFQLLTHRSYFPCVVFQFVLDVISISPVLLTHRSFILTWSSVLVVIGSSPGLVSSLITLFLCSPFITTQLFRLSAFSFLNPRSCSPLQLHRPFTLITFVSFTKVLVFLELNCWRNYLILPMLSPSIIVLFSQLYLPSLFRLNLCSSDICP